MRYERDIFCINTAKNVKLNVVVCIYFAAALNGKEFKNIQHKVKNGTKYISHAEN